MSAERVRLRVLALEPYYGGSHRAVLDGLVERMDADFDLLTLPARKWKWRMRGAAIDMAQRARALAAAGASWDIIFASTFINLAEFRALAGDALVRPDGRATPAIVYFHENQLVYPNRHEAEWDYQFPLTNIVSALTAETCVFNTRWNLEAFLAEIPGFMDRFPDHVPRGLTESIEPKSIVIHPPFDAAAFDSAMGGRDALGGRDSLGVTRSERPRIVWPHRWEHDKDPDTFFEAVARLAEEGLDIEVAVAGQVFRDRPPVFEHAAHVLGDRLVHLGEPDGREAYAALLASADIAVSTAVNEFFGIAMVEACYAGCFPLVPERLAYPELYEAHFRYRGIEELVARLRALVLERPAPGAARAMAERYTFESLVPEYERLFGKVAREGSEWNHDY